MLETPQQSAKPTSRLHGMAVPATHGELVVEQSRQAHGREVPETLVTERTRWRHYPLPDDPFFVYQEIFDTPEDAHGADDFACEGGCATIPLEASVSGEARRQAEDRILTDGRPTQIC